ncbi:MAG: DHA2 family efflux MFS transporter permease subunit [Hyphomicrobiales bacterium]|nr:DHA2 family efflux MFS transporter permease subunit [Hyphomicrobiales bacterium]
MTDAVINDQVFPTGLRRWAIVLCGTVGTWSYSFIWNSVGVALPDMKGSFAATNDQITWVMIGFVVGGAIMTASIGWLSARIGRKQLFMLGMGGFTLSLLGCGAATTLESEVFWRFIQGLAGAPLLSLGQLIVVNAFPRERYTQATSLWALGFVTGNVVAPALAGYLIEHYGWPWIFYANVPLGIGIFLLAWAVVPVTPRTNPKLDWIGFISLIGGVALLQFSLARAERLDWFASTEFIIEISAACLLLYIFVTHTMTATASFVDRRLFRDRNFVLGQVVVFVMGGVIYIPLLLLPLMLQQIAGYPAIEIGNLLFVRGFGSILTLLIMTQLREKIDPRPLVLLGLALTIIPSWRMAYWTTDVLPFEVMWTNFLQGTGTSLLWAPLNRLVLSRLKGPMQDQGFALFYLTYDIGNAIGTSLIIGMHSRYSQINHAVLAEHINPFNELLRYGTLRGNWSIDDIPGLSALDNEVTRQAAMIAYNNTFLIITILTAATAPLILLFKRYAPAN